MINRIVEKLGGFWRYYLLHKYISIKDLLLLRKMDRYLQGKVNTSIGDIEYVDSVSFLSGIEEIFIDEIYKVKSFSNMPPVILDCGANIGLSAIYFSEMYGAKVFAFEADPDIYKALQKNTKENCLKGSVDVINKAIWKNEEGVIFDVEGGYSGQIHQHGHHLVKDSIKIPSIGLRKLLSENEKVDFLKLDIEGAENEVFLDCKGLLNKIEYIFIEWHSITQESQYLGEILNLLKEEGFRYHVKEANTSEHPFVKIDEMCGMDFQLNIFAFK